EDEDVPVLVRSHAHEQSELSVPAAGKPRLAGIGARLEGSQPVPHPPAERQEEVPSVRELLDAVVIIGDKDVPRSVDGDSGGAVELPVPTTRNTRLARSGARLEGRASIPHSPAKAQEEASGVRELLDAVIEALGDKDVSIRRARNVVA